MKVEPLQVKHMRLLAQQGAPGAHEILEQEGYLASLITSGPAFAGTVPEGVVAAVGMVEQNPGNFRCWAITDPLRASYHFTAVCREMRKFFRRFEARRIETIVQVDNHAGMRWVRLLGFEFNTRLRSFNETGDVLLYERVN